MDVSKNRGTPKWMVCIGEPYKNGWFGGTLIFGNTHIYIGMLHHPGCQSQLQLLHHYFGLNLPLDLNSKNRRVTCLIDWTSEEVLSKCRHVSNTKTKKKKSKQYKKHTLFDDGVIRSTSQKPCEKMPASIFVGHDPLRLVGSDQSSGAQRMLKIWGCWNHMFRKIGGFYPPKGWWK